MRLFLLVCAGGALGSGARYLTGLALNLGAWPRGTLLVNVLGCLLMGALMGSGPRTEWRTVLAAGVLGGFTTYSAFNQEVLGLVGQGRAWAALGYAAATLLGGLAAGTLGLWLVRA